jgi:hypothetical protein
MITASDELPYFCAPFKSFINLNNLIMKNFKFVGIGFLVAATLLFSCSKNVSELPVQQNEAQAIAKGSPASVRSSTVAVPF